MKINYEDYLQFKDNITTNNYIEDYTNNIIVKDSTISFIIITKNEERSIERCVNSILDSISNDDELIIVDTGSTDSTLDIIKKYLVNDNIYLKNYYWNNNFAHCRNNSITYANNDWIFFVDSDEYLDRNSIKNLKKYISIIEYYNKSNIFINPTIINTNDHIINGVTRIFKNNNKVKYIGTVHEIPIIEEESYEIFSFENIILYHDGYDMNIVDLNQKINRNLVLLKNMIKMSNDTRWKYLYSRDGKYVWDTERYERSLINVINNESDNYSEYYYAAARDLVELYLNINDIHSAILYLNILKSKGINNSDIFYFENIISWKELKNKEIKLLQSINEYRDEQTRIDYGALHSNYYHIDYLISQIMISLNMISQGINIQTELKDKGVFDYSIDINELLDVVNKLKTKGCSYEV
ncbi:glycosyltransferase family 2 protein [Macrococcus animalis]|uniref:glycosyltransferase family 2 protein n=1 Tax=Macrococcus animalis TaxID=3395467 RepID=UPI0039BDCF2C